MSPFSAPFSGGHPEASGFCFQSERLLYGREPMLLVRNRESRGGEAAGISPKQWRKKMRSRKRLAYHTQKRIGMRSKIVSAATRKRIRVQMSPTTPA